MFRTSFRRGFSTKLAAPCFDLKVTARYVAKRIDVARLHSELQVLWANRSFASVLDRDWLFLKFESRIKDQSGSEEDSVHLAISRRGSSIIFGAPPSDPRFNIDSLIADRRIAQVLDPREKIVQDGEY